MLRFINCSQITWLYRDNLSRWINDTMIHLYYLIDLTKVYVPPTGSIQWLELTLTRWVKSLRLYWKSSCPGSLEMGFLNRSYGKSRLTNSYARLAWTTLHAHQHRQVSVSPSLYYGTRDIHQLGEKIGAQGKSSTLTKKERRPSSTFYLRRRRNTWAVDLPVSFHYYTARRFA